MCTFYIFQLPANEHRIVNIQHLNECSVEVCGRSDKMHDIGFKRVAEFEYVERRHRRIMGYYRMMWYLMVPLYFSGCMRHKSSCECLCSA